MNGDGAEGIGDGVNNDGKKKEKKRK